MTSRFDKAKLPSRHVTEGPARAPHRSYFYAMGHYGGRDTSAVGWRCHMLERGGTVQHRAEPAGAVGEDGGEEGWRALRVNLPPSQ